MTTPEQPSPEDFLRTQAEQDLFEVDRMEHMTQAQQLERLFVQTVADIAVRQALLQMAGEQPELLEDPAVVEAQLPDLQGQLRDTVEKLITARQNQVVAEIKTGRLQRKLTGESED